MGAPGLAFETWEVQIHVAVVLEAGCPMPDAFFAAVGVAKTFQKAPTDSPSAPLCSVYTFHDGNYGLRHSYCYAFSGGWIDR